MLFSIQITKIVKFTFFLLFSKMSTLHKRHYLGCLAESLWKFQQADIFCDVTLVARGDVEICAHSAVLGAVSAKLCAEMHAYSHCKLNTGTTQLDSALSAAAIHRDVCKRYRLFFPNCKEEVLTAILRYVDNHFCQ